MRRLLLLLTTVPLIGCSQRPAAPPAAAATGTPSLAHHPREPFADPARMIQSPMPTAVQINIYQLAVPYGTISRNEKFWKRIDETQGSVAWTGDAFADDARFRSRTQFSYMALGVAAALVAALAAYWALVARKD